MHFTSFAVCARSGVQPSRGVNGECERRLALPARLLLGVIGYSDLVSIARNRTTARAHFKIMQAFHQVLKVIPLKSEIALHRHLNHYILLWNHIEAGM